MDTSRLSQGHLIAGAGGVGLFVFLFLDWFGPFTAWQAFDVVDILLAAIAVVVAGLIAARAAGNEIAVPGGPGAIALAGFAATFITLTFLLEGEERKIGVWLALVSALAITYGGWQALRGGTVSAPRTTAPPPAPPAGGPPPPPAA